MLEVLSNAARHPDCDTASIVELQREIDRLTALQARQIAQWDAQMDWADDGSKSPAHRLARETGMSTTCARTIVNRSRRLRSMPMCAAAFDAGELSTSRVDLLVRANQPKLAELYQRDEDVLMKAASIPNFEDAQKAVCYWIVVAKEASGDSDYKKQLDSRRLSLTKTFGGDYDLDGFLDSINGEIVAAELRRVESALFEEDWAAAKEVLGEGNVTIDSLGRTSQQRRADALVEMAKRSASTPVGSKPVRPLITIHAGYPAFKEMCELSSGTVVTPGMIVPLLSDAEIETIVFQSPKRVLDIRHKRLFTGALRRVIQARDRHCQDQSSCNVPAEECDVDHIVASINGGLTTQENGQCLCAFHNRLKGARAGPAPP